jgi:hypothetical protein
MVKCEYDAAFFARQRKLLKEKEEFVSIDEMFSIKRGESK